VPIDLLFQALDGHGRVYAYFLNGKGVPKAAPMLKDELERGGSGQKKSPDRGAKRMTGAMMVSFTACGGLED
jgi:hypothetical protein